MERRHNVFPEPTRPVRLVVKFALTAMVMFGLYLYDQYRQEMFKAQLNQLKRGMSNDGTSDGAPADVGEDAAGSGVLADEQ